MNVSAHQVFEQLTCNDRLLLKRHLLSFPNELISDPQLELFASSSCERPVRGRPRPALPELVAAFSSMATIRSVTMCRTPMRPLPGARWTRAFIGTCFG
jgi:hypothetical protein